MLKVNVKMTVHRRKSRPIAYLLLSVTTLCRLQRGLVDVCCKGEFRPSAPHLHAVYRCISSLHYIPIITRTLSNVHVHVDTVAECGRNGP